MFRGACQEKGLVLKAKEAFVEFCESGWTHQNLTNWLFARTYTASYFVREIFK
jgi:hypothetical protein